MFDVAVFKRADLNEVSNKLANTINGRILNVIKLPNNFFNVVQVEIPLSDVEEIAKIADVVRIDQYEKPQPKTNAPRKLFREIIQVRPCFYRRATILWRNLVLTARM